MATKQKKPAKSSSAKEKVLKYVKLYEGKVVTPGLYCGPEGKYMAAMSEGKLVLDKNGKPLEFKKTGEFKWV